MTKPFHENDDPSKAHLSPGDEVSQDTDEFVVSNTTSNQQHGEEPAAEDRELLTAYLDGELDAEEMLQVENRVVVVLAVVREYVGARSAYAKTDAFKDEMRFRSHVERIIAIFVLFCGGRQAIFRSTPKVDFQVKMQATMFNLKTWCALDDKKKREVSPKLPRRFRAPVPNPDG